MALQGYNALVKTQSSAIAFTDEATTTSDNKTYQITNATKRVFDYTTNLIVKNDASIVTGYSFNKIAGTVTFPTATVRTITLTGAYVALTTVAEATEYSFEGTLDLGDSTVFQTDSRTFLPINQSATASLSRFYNVDGFFLGMLFDKTVKVIEFYADGGGDPFRIYAFVSSDSVSASIDELIKETVSFQMTDKGVI